MEPIRKFEKIGFACRDDSAVARTQFQRHRLLLGMASAVDVEDHDQGVAGRTRNGRSGTVGPHCRCSHIRNSNQADLPVTDAAVKIGAIGAITLERYELL